MSGAMRVRDESVRATIGITHARQERRVLGRLGGERGEASRQRRLDRRLSASRAVGHDSDELGIGERRRALSRLLRALVRQLKVQQRRAAGHIRVRAGRRC